MDLHTGEPYWLMKNGYRRSFPALGGDHRTDVCVLGAGITGALAAHALAEEGLEVTVLDKRHPGMGSTCASTALLQYEIDEPLASLIDIVGEKRANESYLACHRAIDSIRDIIKKAKLRVAFSKTPSLQYASRPAHVARLRRECEARRRIGIYVRLLDAGEIEKQYGFSAPAALLSDQGA